MVSDETNRLLAKIGQLLAEDTAYPLDGTLLYARLASNMVAPSIFKNRGNHIVFRWPDLSRLGAALLDLWEIEAPDKRWAEIEYVIHSDTFDVTYIYPNEINPDEDEFVRRDRIVKRYFGNKPFIYPPIPDGNAVTQYDL